MSKPILALNSIRGKSGKDTLIEYIEKEGLKVHRVAFADLLKKEVASTIAHDRDEALVLEQIAHGSVKDSPMSQLCISDLPLSGYKSFLVEAATVSHLRPLSMRWHCQVYGTEFVREHLKKPRHWLDKGLVEILNGQSDPSVDVVVVADMRLPNEYAELSRLPNCHTVRLVRTWYQEGTDNVPMHVSDYALMAEPFDALVVNEWGSPERMFDQIKRFL
ncbi:hypothetical protein HBN99_03585 [Pseudomonas oryzihabitans]|uniref:hypothetical protein n=1 Tax=Pseudomonas oryzihabitans TaxID=47885 RepID=UPI00147380C4|nr:hypothetical protein [Pseudomonas oryzihabitans]NMZ63403.1 hypothetical protein [Pseudomonas oryzihabitans]